MAGLCDSEAGLRCWAWEAWLSADYLLKLADHSVDFLAAQAGLVWQSRPAQVYLKGSVEPAALCLRLRTGWEQASRAARFLRRLDAEH
jgi:hypothetical protein